ncbi:class I SAM-dependent methyltransferase [Thermasporomyces composti]|uniref:class I SAM-dependent methyltransferase n=1 Tax=Thermasporomyces composti TaxID=696763 RepID=UPI001B86771A|nr:class I SAM-dependent methyltransferase [Thermasporomyces composti]
MCSTSGCGTGGTTRLAACRARNGHVTGIDLSAPMLDEARRATRAAGLDNIAFEHADAQTRAFPPGGFDAAISRNGVMFFSDPVAAFANVRRALRPRGRLAFSCPQRPEDCEWYVVPVAALLGIPPVGRSVVDAYPGPAPAMFSLADPAHVTALLTRAGFTDVSIDSVEIAQHFGHTVDEAAEAFLGSGPTRYIVEQDAELTYREAHARLTAALGPYATPGGVLLPARYWLVSTENPEVSRDGV